MARGNSIDYDFASGGWTKINDALLTGTDAMFVRLGVGGAPNCCAQGK